jgi:hypothetical protein
VTTLNVSILPFRLLIAEMRDATTDDRAVFVSSPFAARAPSNFGQRPACDDQGKVAGAS